MVQFRFWRSRSVSNLSDKILLQAPLSWSINLTQKRVLPCFPCICVCTGTQELACVLHISRSDKIVYHSDRVSVNSNCCFWNIRVYQEEMSLTRSKIAFKRIVLLPFHNKFSGPWFSSWFIERIPCRMQPRDLWFPMNNVFKRYQGFVVRYRWKFP